MNTEFEKWAVMCGFDISKYRNGNYKSTPTIYAFDCWEEQQKKIDALTEEHTAINADTEQLRTILNLVRNIVVRLDRENAALVKERDELLDALADTQRIFGNIPLSKESGKQWAKNVNILSKYLKSEMKKVEK